jgi:hypothetical protein
MTGTDHYLCPGCGTDVHGQLRSGETFQCGSCLRSFTLYRDEDCGAAAFVERNARDVSHPLFLPRGSVRALVTLTTAVSTWILAFRGKEVPDYCLGLLLTIMASYFAFRRGSEEDGEESFLNAMEDRELPLYLPRGFIRWFLILGFMATGAFLLYQEKLSERTYLEFFAVLGSLLVGYGAGKLAHRFRRGLLHALVSHLLALAVIGATGWLAYLLLTGAHVRSEGLPLALASGISFYFGSR